MTINTSPEQDPRHQIWDQFLETWPIDRILNLTLEEYTAPKSEQPFTWWVEFGLKDLGGIRGGSAFKYGVYYRDDRTKPQGASRGKITGEVYGWYQKYGANPEEAFATVHQHLIDIINAAQIGDLGTIDSIDFSPMLKWKVAFLYQDLENPCILPIFNKSALFYHYTKIDPNAKESDVSYPLLYKLLMSQSSIESENLLATSERLIQEYNQRMSQQRAAWAVPLDLYFPGPDEQQVFLDTEEIEAEAGLAFFSTSQKIKDAATDDYFLFIGEDQVWAWGELIEADEDGYSWTQNKLEPALPIHLDVEPQYDIVKIPSQTWLALYKQIQAKNQIAESIEPEETIVEELPPVGPHRPTQNIILYGPPGTGKTYATLRRALELVLSPEMVKNLDNQEVRALFDQKMREGRIEFVTFHQSYGYEEFIESIRPVLNDKAGEVRYELKDGVFKQIALQAASEGLKEPKTKPEQSEVEFDTLWQELISRVNQDEDIIYYSQANVPYLLEVTRLNSIRIKNIEIDDDGNITEQDKKPRTASKEIAQTIWKHQKTLGPVKDWTYQSLKEVIAGARDTQGGNQYTAFWIVFDALFKLRDEKKVQPQTQEKVSLEAVKQVLNQAGASHKLRFDAQTPQYVLIIDEINRGNISKILGELMTLLEPDKRLGENNELKLPLMYSQQRFGVPPNLHLLGTMNTADRSIALMDVALRRRFRFEELLPNYQALAIVLNQNLPEQPELVKLICDLLQVINARIRYLYDRDHQIGHAFFMQIASLSDLREVMLQRIIPLLQEYFYGAWDKIATVLAYPSDEDGNPMRAGLQYPLIQATDSFAHANLGFLNNDFEPYAHFEIHPDFLGDRWSESELIETFVDILAEMAPARQERLEAILTELAPESDTHLIER